MNKKPNPNTYSREETSYLTYDEKSKGSILDKYNQSRSLKNYVYNAKASSDSNIQNRAPYGPGTYENSRPFAGLPIAFKDIVYACRSAYFTTGIVRNVIDLMIDFICEDVKILHKNKKEEAFFKVWAKKVSLYDVINEFAKHLLIDCNVVVKRSTAKLNSAVEEQWKEQVDKEVKSMAKPDSKLYKEKRQVLNKEIPIRYSFLNVAALEWTDDSSFGGKKQLTFKVNPALHTKIRSGQLDILNQFANSMDTADLDALKNKGTLSLDMSKIYVATSRKDSWQDWAVPYLYAVLSDLKFKEKLHQVDIAAADGTINPIRLWRLGDHKEKILPAEGAISRLADILENNPGGGAVDIIWDSMIDMKDYYPPIDKILGSAKYEQVNKDILVGLGVPEVLLGGPGANFSNSFIQLKTIIERVKFARNQISKWLEQEIRLLCEAMEIATVPVIKFGQMNLEDENTVKKLIVGLLDRGLISGEAVLEIYGEDFDIEVERMKREKKILKENDIEIKGPFNNEVAPFAKMNEGRPSKTKETTTRTTRKSKPLRASVLPDVIKKVEEIDKIITSMYLKANDISNARKLTKAQTEEINSIRVAVLGKINFDEDINEEFIIDSMSELSMNMDFINETDSNVKDFVSLKQRDITLQERKLIEAVNWINKE